MNSDFHYLDGLKLRILCSVILFFGIVAANFTLQEEKDKNALVQAVAYTGRSDFITESFGFDEEGTFLVRIKHRTLSLIEKITE